MLGGSGSGGVGELLSHGSNGRPLPPEHTRQSNGLDQFFSSIQDRSGLNLLDFAGANQSNVSYITSMGHRLSSEDFVRSLELTFGYPDVLEKQGNPQLVTNSSGESWVSLRFIRWRAALGFTPISLPSSAANHRRPPLRYDSSGFLSSGVLPHRREGEAASAL